MASRRVQHLTLDERRAQGKSARAKVPRSSHEGWSPATDRPDPVLLLDQQNRTRDPDLVPVRHGRMMVSPFTFYRGAAKIMAADLKDTPRADLQVQLCGDAHLSNFGGFASPERTLVFDLNDFDETLPGPFEYDVARMAASFTIAGRNNGFSPADADRSAQAAIRAYREAMAEFASMRTLDVWYAHLAVEEMLASLQPSDKLERKQLARTRKTVAKARTKDSLQAQSKLTEVVDGRRRIISDPPVVVPERELIEMAGVTAEELSRQLRQRYRAYRMTLPDDRRRILERFEFVDLARKVVGVGSVGTRAFIGLLEARDGQDPLFLQVKEATASVLEDHLPTSRYKQPGERVVQGQRLMQASSDIFLGWTRGIDESRFYYWRQLRDMKGSAEVELMTPSGMTYYAGFCGWTLARAHARSGDPVAIAAYLGKSDRFDRAMADFAAKYADQNERDHESFVAAVRDGRMSALEGV